MTFTYLRQIDNNLFHRNYRIMILIKGGDAAAEEELSKYTSLSDRVRAKK